MMLHVTELIIVDFKVPLFPTCHNIVVIKELILICYCASCCFTDPHNKGAVVEWSTAEWNQFIGLCCLCWVCN